MIFPNINIEPQRNPGICFVIMCMEVKREAGLTTQEIANEISQELKNRDLQKALYRIRLLAYR
jgi:hypothetical protein